MPDLRRGLYSYYGYQRIDLTNENSRGKSVYCIRANESVIVHNMTDNFIHAYNFPGRTVRLLRVYEVGV